MKISSLVVGAAMVLAVPVLALATPLHGHFSGYAQHAGTPGSYVVNDTYTAYATLDAVQPDPWYNFDVAQQYTVKLTANVDAAYEAPAMILNVEFGSVTVEVYEDDATAADYGNPGTFTDGTLLLSGTVTGMAGQRPNFPNFNWDVVGTVSFSGGVGMNGLLCDPQLGMNDFIAFASPPINPPSGYQEAYNIDWFCDAATSVDESSWGRMKSLYR
jgi:hypothetical protein